MTWLPTLMLPEASTVRSISMIWPEGGGSGGALAGTAPLRAVGPVGGVQPGRQGLDPVPASQHVYPLSVGPDSDEAAGHRGTEPDLLPGHPQVV